jgi:hypothetical protein
MTETCARASAHLDHFQPAAIANICSHVPGRQQPQVSWEGGGHELIINFYTMILLNACTFIQTHLLHHHNQHPTLAPVSRPALTYDAVPTPSVVQLATSTLPHEM